MAEPLAVLSLLASIGQLLDYGARLTSRLRDLGSANGEFAALRARVTALTGLLGRVRVQLSHDRVGGGSGDERQGVAEGLLPVVASCCENIRKILGMVDRVMPVAAAIGGDSGEKKKPMVLLFNKYVRAAKALAMDKEFKKLSQQLGESVQLISLWQTTVLVDLVGRRVDGAGEEGGVGEMPDAARERAVVNGSVDRTPDTSEDSEYSEGSEGATDHVHTTTVVVRTSTAVASDAVDDSDRPPSDDSRPSTCAQHCSCTCHRPFQLSTPAQLASWLGHLSVSSSGSLTPLTPFRLPCTERRCRRHATSSTRVTLRLPDWLLPIALNLSLSSTALNTHINLNTLRILPDTAEVFSVISRGDLAYLQQMFAARQASVYDVSRSNWSLVHTAFTLGKMDIASFLVSEGADLTICATNGSRVIERAWFCAQKSTTEAGGYVLSDNDILRNVDVDDFVSSQQYTLVHKILLGLAGSLSLEDLLRASTREIDVQDVSGATPLWWASAQGNLVALRTLLKYGADQNIGAGLKQLPLHVARSADTARILMNASVDGRQMSALDDLGRMPLHCYCYRQVGPNQDLVKAVVSEYGADTNAVASGGQTPLHYAVMFGNSELIEPLLEGGADMSFRMKNGMTPLLAALRYDKASCVSLLLAKGADVLATMNDGEGVFHLAARWAGVRCLGSLVDHVHSSEGIAVLLDEAELRQPYESRSGRPPDLDEAFVNLLEVLKRWNMLRPCERGLPSVTDYRSDLSMPGAFR
ncbi:putative ankyrin repeat protein [Cyphellophora attinorum]|uniref:Putative ankyrin repeat protein n=1 Tax=Cyphellophora attinorum TaxID=1664694 RepID=A0A0N1H5B9_9EURO|nr:putative ankyrin repeat protein [Phialophora attinorum]KPI37537.1 putative ankyrin repeat protein [Phialophora attinorum]